jgi:hypothetical protein
VCPSNPRETLPIVTNIERDGVGLGGSFSGLLNGKANGTRMSKEKTPAKQYGIDEPEIQR